MAGLIFGAAVVFALLVLGLVLARALERMAPPDEPASEDLVGALGTVVIRIPDTGTGEVAITEPGQRRRVTAQAETPIPEGATVVVVDVPAPDAVIVAESGF